MYIPWWNEGQKKKREMNDSKAEDQQTERRGEITKPSEGLMLVRWTSSRWADWETSGSDDTHTMCSHTSDRVLHCKKESRAELFQQ